MLRIDAVAIELVRDAMPMIREIERFDVDLARQARRAVMSAALNVAEGGDQPGKRRALHYRIAMGSAREAWTALLVAEAAGYVGKPSADIQNKFSHVIGTLHKCLVPKKQS